MSPGRNDGSGTCSASFGALRRSLGVLVAHDFSREPLSRESGERGNRVEKRCFTLPRCVDAESERRGRARPWPTVSDTPPDRLSLDPRSEHYDEALLESRRRASGSTGRKRPTSSNIRVGGLDPGGRRAQPRPLWAADDDQAPGQGRTLFRKPGSARRRRRRRLRGIGRASLRRPRSFLTPSRRGERGQRRNAAPAPAPPRRRRGSRLSRLESGPATFSPSHAPNSLPIIAELLCACAARRAGAGECSRPVRWRNPTKSWLAKSPNAPRCELFSAVFRDWHGA